MSLLQNCLQFGDKRQGMTSVVPWRFSQSLSNFASGSQVFYFRLARSRCNSR
jgi:hypothetical protein